MLQPQLADTHADGAGGNHYDLVSCIFKVADDLAELLHLTDIQVTGGMGQGGGSDLNTDSHVDIPAFWSYFLHYGIKSQKCQSGLQKTRDAAVDFVKNSGMINRFATNFSSNLQISPLS